MGFGKIIRMNCHILSNLAISHVLNARIGKILRGILLLYLE